MTPEACWALLADARHGVLSTVSAGRGVDAVPVVYAVDPVGPRLLLPIDTVKAKRTVALRRLDDLRADPRCVLLVEHYDDDWSQLWWVRIHGTAVEVPVADEAVELLTGRYPQYRAPGAIALLLALTPTGIAGWRA